MNVSSCEDIIKLAHPTGATSADLLIHVILPKICSLIDVIPPVNVTAQEKLFYGHCCDPIPTMILNRTVLHYHNDTDQEKLINDVCSYMDINGKNRDEVLYKDLCVKTIIATGLLGPAYRLLTFLVLSVLSPIGLFANILILMTVYKVKHLRNTTGYFICNLAIADLLVIFTNVLFVVLNTTGEMKSANDRINEFLFPTFDVVIGSASLLHVTAVTIERGIAVSIPLKYPRYLNERTATKMIIGIWAYCVFLLLLGLLRIPIKSSIYVNVFFCLAATLSFFIPCIFVIVSYGFILVSAINNMKMEQKISKVIMVIAMMDQENLEQVSSMRPARFREIKIACNVAIMTVPFVCGWGYFIVCNMYEVVTKKDITGFQNWLIPCMPFIISCLNPLTYLMFTRSLRKSSFQLLLKSKLCKKLAKSFVKKDIENPNSSFIVNDRSMSYVDDSKRHSRQCENMDGKSNDSERGNLLPPVTANGDVS